MVSQQRRSIQASVSRKGSGSGTWWGNAVYGAVLLLVGAALVALLLYLQVLSSMSQLQQQGQPQQQQIRNSKKALTSSQQQSIQTPKQAAAEAARLIQAVVQDQQQQVQQQSKVGYGQKPVTEKVTPLKPDAAALSSSSSSHSKETLLLKTTSMGTLKIVLRPDLSPESVDYIHQLVKHVSQSNQPCRNCRLYRAEKPGILQGILRHPNVAPSTTLGSCPSGFDTVKNDCPKWDANCQCHGPVMTKGMVAWAAGKSGPDFFIDNYPSPAKWWGTQHTGMYECAFLFLVGESFSTVLLCVLIFVL